jgi:hypothetical protein
MKIQKLILSDFYNLKITGYLFNHVCGMGWQADAFTFHFSFSTHQKCLLHRTNHGIA